MTKKQLEFIRGLTALTRKTGIAFAGCGCCGSPFLSEEDVSDDRAGYASQDSCNSKTDHIGWIAPSDTYDWEHYSDRIIR